MCSIFAPELPEPWSYHVPEVVLLFPIGADWRTLGSHNQGACTGESDIGQIPSHVNVAVLPLRATVG